ncbi:MAG: hypothetical protein ABSF69_09160 [Polyangiaceae bacterium]|jgi:hypothetical protein
MILFSISLGVVAVLQLRESQNRESVVVHGERCSVQPLNSARTADAQGARSSAPIVCELAQAPAVRSIVREFERRPGSVESEANQRWGSAHPPSPGERRFSEMAVI